MLADDFPANVLYADSQKPTAGGALLIKVGCPRHAGISDLAITVSLLSSDVSLVYAIRI